MPVVLRLIDDRRAPTPHLRNGTDRTVSPTGTNVVLGRAQSLQRQDEIIGMDVPIRRTLFFALPTMWRRRWRADEELLDGLWGVEVSVRHGIDGCGLTKIDADAVAEEL